MNRIIFFDCEYVYYPVRAECASFLGSWLLFREESRFLGQF